MLKRLIAILGLSLLSLPSLAAANAPTSFIARAGGEAGGGGGTADPGRRLDANEIHGILLEIQQPTEAFFNFLSVNFFEPMAGTYLGTIHRPELGAKLFAGLKEDAVMRKVRTIRPSILDQGACEGPDREHHEASALKNPDRVCFSVELLAQRGDIRVSNAHTILVALAAHEYSHLVDAGEDEADFIQKELALKNFSERASQLVSSDFRSLDRVLAELSRNTAWLTKQVALRAPMPELCFDLATVAAKSFIKIESAYDWSAGVSYFSRAQFNKALPALYKVNNLTAFCRRDPELMAFQQKIFGSRQEVSTEEFLNAMGSQGHMHVQGVVRRLAYGDYRTLALEVADLAAAVAALLPAGAKPNEGTEPPRLQTYGP